MDGARGWMKTVGGVIISGASNFGKRERRLISSIVLGYVLYPCCLAVYLPCTCNWKCTE